MTPVLAHPESPAVQAAPTLRPLSTMPSQSLSNPSHISGPQRIGMPPRQIKLETTVSFGFSGNWHPVVALQTLSVQRLPSSHWVLSGVCETLPVAASQASTVQTILSSILTGVLTQPTADLQESAVQRLLSLQVISIP